VIRKYLTVEFPVTFLWAVSLLVVIQAWRLGGSDLIDAGLAGIAASAAVLVLGWISVLPVSLSAKIIKHPLKPEVRNAMLLIATYVFVALEVLGRHMAASH
jgi:hypothetical protein